MLKLTIPSKFPVFNNIFTSHCIALQVRKMTTLNLNMENSELNYLYQKLPSGKCKIDKGTILCLIKDLK